MERLFYQYASVDTVGQMTHMLVDEFATRKGHHARIILDAKTGRLLYFVSDRDASAITAVLQDVLGGVRSIVSDFAPGMAKAVTSVFLDAAH